MKRRDVLKATTGAMATMGLAGCSGDSGDGENNANGNGGGGNNCGTPAESLESALPNTTDSEYQMYGDPSAAEFERIERTNVTNSLGAPYVPSGGDLFENGHGFVVIEFNSAADAQAAVSDLQSSANSGGNTVAYVRVENYLYLGEGQSRSSVTELMGLSEPLSQCADDALSFVESTTDTTDTGG